MEPGIGEHDIFEQRGRSLRGVGTSVHVEDQGTARRASPASGPREPALHISDAPSRHDHLVGPRVAKRSEPPSTIARDASTPQPPSSHTSALAARSHPRISTTSAAVIVMSMSDCQFRYAALGSGCASTSAFALPQHPHQHGSKDPVLLAVDEELGEGAALWVGPELSRSGRPARSREASGRGGARRGGRDRGRRCVHGAGARPARSCAPGRTLSTRYV